MGVKVSLNLPKGLFTAEDSMRLALNTVATVKLRTSKGIDANGKAFKDYSDTALSVSTKGARLKPKGGVPSKSGASVYYSGGYQQYKEESRDRGDKSDSAEIDLVLSGNMMNNFVVLEASQNGFKVGLTSEAQYGYYVNEDREFIGLTDKDVDILVKAFEIDLRSKLK